LVWLCSVDTGKIYARTNIGRGWGERMVSPLGELSEGATKDVQEEKGCNSIKNVELLVWGSLTPKESCLRIAKRKAEHMQQIWINANKASLREKNRAEAIGGRTKGSSWIEGRGGFAGGLRGSLVGRAPGEERGDISPR